MCVNFMNKLVKVMLMPLTKIDECLNSLVGVSRSVLLSALVDNLETS